MPDPQNPQSDDENRLAVHSGSRLSVISSGGQLALSEIVNRSLVHIQTSKNLSTLHRLGTHELYDPDYQLVCIIANQLGISPEDTLKRMMEVPECASEWHSQEFLDQFRTSIADGRFINLLIFQRSLPISKFPSIGGLKIENLGFELHFLDVEPVRLSNLDLEFLTNLKRLYCSGHSLTKLDLSVVPQLTFLNCSCNDLKEIDLSVIPKLTSLSVQGNRISELNFSANKNLTSLECGCNELKILNLSMIPRLTCLRCISTDIRKLDLSFVPDLEILDCSENRMKSLDLSRTSKLLDLKCNYLELNKLDLSGTPNLRTLDCGSNNLKELDLSFVPSLIDLICTGNKITHLDLSAVPSLKKLDCWLNFQLISLDIRDLHHIEVLKTSSSTKIIQRPDQHFK